MMNNWDIILDEAFNAYNNGRFDQAESLCRQVISASPGHGDALFLLGLIAYQSGALEPAADLLFQAVKLYPHIENYTLTLASILYRQNRLNEALGYYQKFPQNPKGLAEQGFIYFSLGDKNKALESFQSALSVSPQLPEAKLGIALLKQDIKALEKLAKASHLPDAWFYLSRAYRQTGHLKSALTAIDKTGLKQILYLIEKALIYQDLKKYDQALSLYQQAMRLAPHNPDIWANQANIFKARGEFAAAENYYKRALAQDDKHLAARHNLADLLYKMDRIAESLEQYRTVLIQHPDDVSALYNLAIILEKTGEYADSLGLYFKVLLSGQAPAGLDWRIANTLALLAENNQKLAIDFATGWYKNFPDNPVARHTLFALTGKDEGDNKEYIQKLYDDFSITYDNKMKELQSCSVVEMKKILPRQKYNKALDLGCGTGAWGRAFHKYLGHLIGVDLSSKMIEIAAHIKPYNKLIKSDILSYLDKDKTKFNLITALDVLNYAPDVRPIFTKVSDHLRAGGIFAFSLEVTDKKEPFLGLHGRYLYPKDYLLAELQKVGLTVIKQKEIPLRLEGKSFAPGLIVVVQK